MPVVDVVRDLATLDGGAVLEAALSSCPDFVRERMERLLSAAPLGAGNDGWAGAGPRQQMFVAVRQVLTVLAKQRPCVIVVEDLHWADTSTVGLAEYLLAPHHWCGVPLVMSYRDDPPESAGGAPPAQAFMDHALRRNDVRWISLQPLAAEHVADQIAALTGGRRYASGL
jgi:predicted ATPase